MHITHFIIFIFIFTLSQTSFSDNYIDSGKEYLSNDELSSAIIQFKNQLKKDPKDAEARYLLGTAYIQDKDYNAAKKELSRAYKLAPDNDEYRLFYAESLLLTGNSTQAFTLLEKEIGDIQLDIKRMEFIAQIHIVNKQNDKAQKLLQQLLNKDIKSDQKAKIELLLAKIALSENQLEKASQLIQSSLETTPDDLEALNIKGTLLYLSKDYPQAINLYSQLIEKNPDSVMFNLQRARLYMITNQGVKAEDDLNHLLSLNNKNIFANHLMSKLKLQEKDYKSAADYSQKVLSVNPSYNDALLVSGASNYFLGRFNQAEKSLSLYITKNPNDPYAHGMIADIYIQQKKYQTAITIIEGMDNKVLKNNPLLLKTLRSAYIATGENKKAIAILESLGKTESIDKMLQEAKIIEDLNNSSDMSLAIKKLEDYSNKYPKNTKKIDYFLINYYIQQNQLDKAENKLVSLLKVTTDDPNLYTFKAALEIKKLNTAQAKVDFDQAILLDQNNIPANMGLAQLAVNENNRILAEEYYEKIIKIDDKYSNAYVSLYQLAFNNQEFEQAEEYLLQAYNKNSGDVTAQLQVAAFMAVFYKKTNNTDQLKWLENNLSADYPNNIAVLSFLAKIQIKLKQYDDAEASLHKIIYDNENDTEHRLLLANILIEQNKQEDLIIELIDDVLKVEEDNTFALQLKISQLIKTNDFGTAIHIAKQRTGLFPNNPIGPTLEGDIYSAEQKPDLALLSYKNAYSIEPNTYLANKLALLYQRKSEHKIASRYYKDILKHEPNNTVALNNISWAYFQLNDLQQALYYAEKAYKNDPNFAPIIDNYAYILLADKQVEKALKLFFTAAKLAPNNKNIQFHLAKAYYEKGYDSEAKQILKQILKYEKNDKSLFSEKEKASELFKKL